MGAKHIFPDSALLTRLTALIVQLAYCITQVATDKQLKLRLPRLDFDTRHAAQWHHEAGASVTIFESLNADMTWRLVRRASRIR